VTWSYDAIAGFYATDMGRSMRFDDAGYYAARVEAPVLELGCGTGRILLELLARGIDAVGIDRSRPMLRQLQRDAAGRGIAPSIAQADVRALPVRGSFRTVLAPYALVTYLTGADELESFLYAARQLLSPGGRMVLDSFVPRPVERFHEFRHDYRRPHGAGALERAKRIRVEPDGSNRIERRYRLLDAADQVVDEVTTLDRIRPYSESQLCAAAARCGMQPARRDYDYGQGDRAEDAQFFTLWLAPAPNG
jgi:SAM-dependent methyltransferase